MSYSMKRITISILIVAIILALCLSTTFFAKKAYADPDSMTYNIAGGTNLGLGLGGPDSASFWFFIDEVPTGATAVSLVVSCAYIDYPDEWDTVSLYEPDGTMHDIGVLATSSGSAIPTTVSFTLDPSWIKPGKTIIYVNIDTGWYAEVYGGTLTLWYGEAAPRTSELACQMVWINEDGNFQFSFINLYADNNWVKIYDMEGNMVYEVNMPTDNGNLIVDLSDGMYTVKTFHDQPDPIQEFVIGKPAPEAEM